MLAAYIPTPMRAAIAMTAMITVLNGNSTPFRMPNAAPLFSTCVMSMKPGTIVTLSCSGTDARTIALVAWSIVTTTSGSHTSRCRRGAAAASVSAPAASGSSIALSMNGLRDRVLAAAAQPGESRLGGYRRHDSPAALAFDPRGAFDGDPRPSLPVRLHIVGCRPKLDL